MPTKTYCEKKYPKNSLDYSLCTLYRKTGYLDKYGGALLTTIFTCLIFSAILGYLFVNNNLKELKGDWPRKRCSPLIMPFAGIINAPAGESKAEYTVQNFTECVSTTLESVANVAFLPQAYVSGLLGTNLGNLNINIGSLRGVIAYIRNIFAELIERLMGVLLNLSLAINNIFVKVQDLFKKVEAAGIATLYTGVSGVYALFSFFWLFIIVMFELIFFLITLSLKNLGMFFAGLPFIWNFFFLGVFIFAIILAIVLLVIMITVVIMVFNVTSKWQSPHESHCFGGATPIKMRAGGEKEIRNIRLGEILADGGRVTALFKLSTFQQELFNLDGIIVTGKHMVYQEEKGWIKVSDHPSSLKTLGGRHPYVYCLNTTMKQIEVGSHRFMDWDEVDEIDIIKLNLVARNNLPIAPVKDDIHKYMDGGFIGETTVELADGRSMAIKDLVINDQLRFGERVLGVVEIDAKYLSCLREFSVKGSRFVGGPNLRLADRDLGNISSLDLGQSSARIVERLYHVITDSKFLTVNGIQFFDYNGALEPLLWNGRDPSVF